MFVCVRVCFFMCDVQTMTQTGIDIVIGRESIYYGNMADRFQNETVRTRRYAFNQHTRTYIVINLFLFTSGFVSPCGRLMNT